MVFVAVAIRFGYPAEGTVGLLPRVGAASSACSPTRSASGARSPGLLAPPGALRHADRRQRPRRPRHPGRDQLHRRAAEQALGPDGEQAVQPVGSEPQRAVEARLAAAGAGVRAGAAVPALSGQDARSTVRVEARSRPSTSIPTRSRRSPSRTSIERMPTIVFNYKGRTERVNVGQRAGHRPTRIIKVVSGQQRKVYFTQGHGEKDTTSAERDGYNAIADRARPRELHGRQARASRSRARCPTTRRWSSSPGRRPISSRRKSTR